MRIRSLLSLLTFACAPPLAYAQTTHPELPRAVVSTAMPTTTRVLSVAASGNLQAAIDSAKGGDAIELACGATYTGAFTLPAKTSGPAWIVIRPSCWASLPAPGRRMTPAVANALHLPKLVTPNNAPAIATDDGAHHYRLVGLELTMANAANVLVALGTDVQATVAQVPHDLVLDRVYLHGDTVRTLRRAVAMNSASTAIVDSYISDVHENGADSQTIATWTGLGPFLIQNNYLESGGEIMMFGGGDPSVPNTVPSDITIRQNHLTRPAAWKGVWSVKNLFELKNASHVLIEGNVMENVWADAQDGTAILLKSVNQDGRCTWCGTSHVTIRNNIVRNVGAAFNLAAAPEANLAVPMHDVAIVNNLVTNIGAAPFPGPHRFAILQGDLAGVTIAHNTVYTPVFHTALVLVPEGARLSRLAFRDNLIAGLPNYGLTGEGFAPGAVAMAAYAPDGVVAGNLLVGMEDLYHTLPAKYPPGTLFADSISQVGFVNVAAGDLRLIPGSAFVGKASDGTNPGADLDAIAVATKGVTDGSPTPLPVPVPVPIPTPTPVPGPLPALTLDQLRAAITALEKVTGPGGRENLTIKGALEPVESYLKAILTTITTCGSSAW